MTRKFTERGSVVLVLVLSAAVLVIVIDARAGGMRLERGGGSRKGAKLAKWLARGGFTTEATEGTKAFLGDGARRWPRNWEISELAGVRSPANYANQRLCSYPPVPVPRRATIAAWAQAHRWFNY